MALPLPDDEEARNQIIDAHLRFICVDRIVQRPAVVNLFLPGRDNQGIRSGILDEFRKGTRWTLLPIVQHPPSNVHYLRTADPFARWLQHPDRRARARADFLIQHRLPINRRWAQRLGLRDLDPESAGQRTLNTINFRLESDILYLRSADAPINIAVLFGLILGVEFKHIMLDANTFFSNSGLASNPFQNPVEVALAMLSSYGCSAFTKFITTNFMPTHINARLPANLYMVLDAPLFNCGLYQDRLVASPCNNPDHVYEPIHDNLDSRNISQQRPFCIHGSRQGALPRGPAIDILANDKIDDPRLYTPLGTRQPLNQTEIMEIVSLRKHWTEWNRVVQTWKGMSVPELHFVRLQHCHARAP